MTVFEDDQEVVVPSSNIPLSGSQQDHLQSLIPTNLTKDERMPKYVELLGLLMLCFQEQIKHNYCMESNWRESNRSFQSTGKSNVSAKKCLLGSG